MKEVEQLENLINSFEILACDISERTKHIALSKERIESAYTCIHHATLNVASLVNNSGVLHLGLMEVIMQREVTELFGSLETLRKSLLASTIRMIGSAQSAVNEIKMDLPSRYNHRLKDSRLVIFESLHELKKIENFLSSTNYSSV